MKNRSKNRARAAALLLSGLLLILPLGQMGAMAQTAEKSPELVLPGGDTFGGELHTKGVLVVGTAAVDCPGEDISPAEQAGVKAGDIILSIDGKEISSVTAMVELVADSEGKPVQIELQRQGKHTEGSLHLLSPRNGELFGAGARHLRQRYRCADASLSRNRDGREDQQRPQGSKGRSR